MAVKKASGVLRPYYSVAKSASLDAFYGPYNSFEEVFQRIPISFRHVGRIVGVIINGKVVDYKFKAGVENTDLVLSTDWDDVSNKPETLEGLNIDVEDPRFKESLEDIVDKLPIYNTMQEAVSALGVGKLFRYSSENFDGVVSLNDSAVFKTA